MKKHFNIAGPCIPEEHYMLPAQKRLSNIMDFIDKNQYYVIHAARQTGKTTLLLDLVKQLNSEKNTMQYTVLLKRLKVLMMQGKVYPL